MPWPTPKPLDTVTPSSGETLRSCPLRLAFSRDKRFSWLRLISTWSVLGSAAHRVSELAVQGRLDDCTTVEAAQAKALALWDEEVGEGWERILASPGRLADPPEPERWPGYQVTRLRSVRRALQDYHPTTHPAERAVGRKVRVELELTDPGSSLKGRIDRVEERDGALTVIDIKSALRGRTSLRPSYRRQLLVYAYLVNRAEGRWPQWAAIRYLDGTSDEIEVLPSEAETVAFELLALREDYDAAVHAGAEVSLLARPSEEACAFCDFRCACEPFFAQLDLGWELYRAAVLGTVESVEALEDTVRLQLKIESSSLALPGTYVGVRGLPAALAPETGSRVALSGLRSDIAVDVLTVCWDSRYAQWT